MRRKDGRTGPIPGGRQSRYPLEQIGQGGMGIVFWVTHTRLNRDVVLKILPEPFVSDSQRIGRCREKSQRGFVNLTSTLDTLGKPSYLTWASGWEILDHSHDRIKLGQADGRSLIIAMIASNLAICSLEGLGPLPDTKMPKAASPSGL